MSRGTEALERCIEELESSANMFRHEIVPAARAELAELKGGWEAVQKERKWMLATVEHFGPGNYEYVRKLVRERALSTPAPVSTPPARHEIYEVEPVPAPPVDAAIPERLWCSYPDCPCDREFNGVCQFKPRTDAHRFDVLNQLIIMQRAEVEELKRHLRWALELIGPDQREYKIGDDNRLDDARKAASGE